MNKITIYGEFYDSYIYKNFLLLIGADKKAHFLDWHKFIKSQTPYPNHIGYICAFLKSNYLYEQHFQTMFADKEIKKVLKARFDEIKDIEIPFETIPLTKKSGEFNFLPADIGIYYDYLYYGDSYGLHRRKLKINNKRVLSPYCEDLVHNTQVVSIDVRDGGFVRYSTLDKGLWEFNISKHSTHNNNEDAIKKITDSHASFSTENKISTLVGSYFDKSKFIEQIWEKHEKEKDKAFWQTKFVAEHDLSEIFGMKGFFISADDKIYLLNEQGVFLVRYDNRSAAGECFLKNIEGNIVECIRNIGIDISSIICASVEFFGVVVEYKNKIQVLLSTGNIFEKEYEEKQLIGWRTFRRSIDYTNQLHLIFNDRIEIYSFNEDYFENQKEKVFGVKSFYKTWNFNKKS